MNEWNTRKGEIEDADRQVAATLAAALVARGFNIPNTAMAAAQAVDIYRHVLEQLQMAATGGMRDHAPAIL
ncbi:hypothetical protein [Lysobacter sp. Root494]|uniref:hypothetical protein n=1 Tax=Lysobacter sp. Root494 TaxID=1736549 RepID=UPI0006FE7022|nr:hypothetical protein [Lysobacter sp. Root494]KQY54938.1 hypothetical protein ASD14_01880 [Lysobacter sp. Root494]